MRAINEVQSKRSRAAEALRAILHRVSAIKLKGIDFESPDRERKIDILAHIDVHGHSHTLVCAVNESDQPSHVRMALKELRSRVAKTDGSATPVLILPHISDEAQALCAESKAGILDLEGNARIAVGEVFIGMRSLPPAGRRADRAVCGRELAGVA
jgi:hypothetical protein